MPADLLIIPNKNSSTLNPHIQFSGSAVNTIRLEAQPSGSVAFVGNSGSLFSVTDALSGSLMAVSDISGLPILEVFSDDKVVMGKFNSNALVVTGSNVGVGTSTPNSALNVNGDTNVTGSLVVAKSGGTLSNTAIRATAGNNAGYFGSNQLVMSWDGGLSYSHAIKTRHDAGILGNNAIDFYIWKAGTDAAATIGTQQVMSLFDNARVSINKTSANATLDVYGNTIITGSLTVTGNINGTVVASAPDFSSVFLLMGA